MPHKLPPPKRVNTDCNEAVYFISITSLRFLKIKSKSDTLSSRNLAALFHYSAKFSLSLSINFNLLASHQDEVRPSSKHKPIEL